jgi:hypothetical protein
MTPKEMPSWYIEKAGEFSTEDHMSDVECPIIIKCFKKAYELLAPHIIDWQPIEKNQKFEQDINEILYYGYWESDINEKSMMPGSHVADSFTPTHWTHIMPPKEVEGE